jgi:hypothetical protein
VHDTIGFEIEGIPSVFIASSEFADAAEVQAEALGLSEVSGVFVPHPIQDATDEELRAKADGVVDEVLEALRE